MKTCIITFLSFLLSIGVFAQNYKYEYAGRLTPSVNKEKLKDIQFITELAPELWHKIALPYKEQMELDRQRKIAEPFQGYYFASKENFYNKFVYYVIDYVSIEIETTSNGKTHTAQSSSDKLTAEQKNMLYNVDLNTNINIKIMFKYKSQLGYNFGDNTRVTEGKVLVTVVPETEAEYPGGFEQMSAYLVKNVFDKISEKSVSWKIHQAIVKFTINEEGQIVNAKISRTSTDSKADKLLLDAFNKMPAWKPAKNSKGVKVKQEFSIPFGDGGGDGC